MLLWLSISEFSFDKKSWKSLVFYLKSEIKRLLRKNVGIKDTFLLFKDMFSKDQ